MIVMSFDDASRSIQCLEWVISIREYLMLLESSLLKRVSEGCTKAVDMSVSRSGLAGEGSDLGGDTAQRRVHRRLGEDHRRGVAVAEGLPYGYRVVHVGHLDSACGLVGEQLVRRVRVEVAGVHGRDVRAQRHLPRDVEKGAVLGHAG